ncbi:hypothetical protein TrCOL_g6060 [Triparma columacea]|uniref:Uncharacterized protein n=1 Tax=Triparma columacea TaxID=722753 RepID=A0A9W7G5L7_9STRA|nr:hypothetical protein TrCOL_g6060 [Triparma columacea]
MEYNYDDKEEDNDEDEDDDDNEEDDQRRKQKTGIDAGVSKALQGHPVILQGHKMKNKDFDMASEYGVEGQERIAEEAAAAAQRKCATCGSGESCEEDVDNVGTWYCTKCWEEYDNGSGEEEGKGEQQGQQRRSDEDDDSFRVRVITLTPNSIINTIWYKV